MRRRSVLVLGVCWLGLVFAAGCGARPDGEAPPGEDAGIEPSTLTVRLSASQIDWVDGTATPASVTALLVAPDGTETDVSAQTTFAVAPFEIATVAAQQLVVTGAAAGAGRVIAGFDGLAAEAAFEVRVTETVPGSADPSVAGLFAAATPDTASALEIAYPPAGAMVPPNLGEMEVHWRDPAGKDVYEVQLSGGFVTLRTYVTSLGAATWHVLAAASWEKLSSGAAGVELTVRVRGLATAAPATYVEGSEVVRIAAEAVKGGVYYWNATAGALMRFDMTAAATTAERFYPPVGQTGCVGCHAVSRDGTVVSIRREGSNLNFGNALTVATLAPMLAESSQRWNFSAVHPNNRDLVTTTENGLYVTDLTTGATTPLHTTSRITHPEVSPDGLHVVAIEVLAGNEVWTEASRLVVFDYDPVTRIASPPRTLLDVDPAYPFYPSYSPDGRWVLFNRATGADSYDHRDAELWVIEADGSGAPLRLDQAEVTGTYNSWPKFTPFDGHEPTATGSEPIVWFTVASRRPFGVRSATNQKPQLWLAPFYPERAAAGQPASAPMVRLPFQNLAEGNHTAQWTEEIVTLQ